jgi:hypothetical protein
MFKKLDAAGQDCLTLDYASAWVRGIPNCKVWEKIPEGELTEYRFNSSGYRNNFDFGPKSPDTYRIVMIGTSMAAGFRVPEQQTFGALLPAELSRRTGRKVELYNEALPWRVSSSLQRYFNETIATNPDLILWILMPSDIENPSWVHRDGVNPLSQRAGVWHRIRAALATGSFRSSIAAIFIQSRTATLLRILLYASPSQYVKSALHEGDYKTEFLKSEPSPEWQKDLSGFKSNAANIEGQASKAGIPLVAVLLPDRKQAAMISLMGDWPRGFDPYKLDNDLRAIISNHGGTYIDILPDFRAIPNPQLDYFAIDGHLNPKGHAMINRLLSEKLTNGAVAGLTASGQKRIGSETGQ